MIEKMIYESTEYLVRHHVIGEEDRDIYEYGFHILYNNMIDIISIAIIAIWSNMVLQTIMYHIAFICLRSSAGGYHAKTHIRCFVMSSFIFILSLYGISLINSFFIDIVLACLSVLLIWIYAPLEHANNPLNTEKRKRLRIVSRLLSLVLLYIICMVHFLANESLAWIATSLAFGMVSHTVLILAALIEYYCSNKKL